MSEANWIRSHQYDSWRGCLYCKNNNWQRDNFCAAYPNDPPFEILSGLVDHLVVRPGQIGDTVYEDNGLTETEAFTRGLEIVTNSLEG